MEKVKFNNTPNNRVQIRLTTSAGVQNIDYFTSRAVAVVGVVFAMKTDGLYVLIGQRSKKMMDEAGKFGVCCGYLDWGETTFEAMIREVYEETSLYLPDYEKYLVFDNNKQLIKIDDNPLSNRQNVSLTFVTYYNFINDMDVFPNHIETFKNKETEQVIWLKMIDFFNDTDKFQWAFHHDETIKHAYNFLNKTKHI